jgi:hypothetical protein
MLKLLKLFICQNVKIVEEMKTNLLLEMSKIHKRNVFDNFSIEHFKRNPKIYDHIKRADLKSSN